MRSLPDRLCASLMLAKINSYFLTCTTVLYLVTAGCTRLQTIENSNSNSQIAQTTDRSFCPVMETRNWHAWIDRLGQKESRLNIRGEVDLPTPGYKVEWQPGILDRRRPPAQRISLSLVPPEGIVAQVITPTKVNFTMPTSILEYRSVMIYCGDKLLAEIPDVTPQEKANFPIKIGTFTTDRLFDAGGGGCGMSLWQAKTNPQQQGFLFFHGLEDAKALMVFDSKMTNLIRKSSQGKEFYGQKTEQVFITEDDKISVEVNVNFGAAGEIESVNIPSGTITVRAEDRIQQFSVVGDAGC